MPGARHRDAAAIEANAPTFAQWQQELEAPDDTAAPPAVRRFAQTTTNATVTKTQVPKEILVVASKLKDYIRLRSEMNTSAGVMEILSDKLRELCDEAIDRARVAGRKTVMDRDFEGD